MYDIFVDSSHLFLWFAHWNRMAFSVVERSRRQAMDFLPTCFKLGRCNGVIKSNGSMIIW